jgi:hypothetical protein
MSKLLDNKQQIIHIVSEVIILIGITYYFSSKNKKIMQYIEDLSQRIDEQEDTIQKHDKLIKQLINNVHQLSSIQADKHQPSQQPQQSQQSQPSQQSQQQHKSQKSNQSHKSHNLKKNNLKNSSIPVVKPQSSRSENIRSKQFNQPILEEISSEESSEDESELDREMEDELNELKNEHSLKNKNI